MPGEYFGKILKEKKGQKKGTELFLTLVELTEEAFEKFEEAVKVWRNEDYERGYELRDEIIKMEREADEIKDVFFETIFIRKSYLPQITEERYNMMLNADQVMDRIERAVRVLCLKKIDHSYFPPEFDQILDKTDKVMELFVKANEYFFENYEKAAKAARKLEVVRDEVRDLYFIIQGKCVNDELPRGTERVLNVTTRISITAEEGIDYLKVLMAKHS